MKLSLLTQSRFFPGLASLPVTLLFDLCMLPHHSYRWLCQCVLGSPTLGIHQDGSCASRRLPHTALQCWWLLTLVAGKGTSTGRGTSFSLSTFSHGWISMYSWAFEGNIIFGDGKGAEKTMGKWLEGNHRFLHSEQKILFKRSKRPSLFSN